MYMAPITRAEQAPPASPALRHIVGLPVLALAVLAMLPWLLLHALFAGVVLTTRFATQAVDYAGQVALGR